MNRNGDEQADRPPRFKGCYSQSLAVFRFLDFVNGAKDQLNLSAQLLLGNAEPFGQEGCDIGIPELS
jgi:hypothetical protein